MVQALVHRYDNEADILAVEEKGFSDVYRRAATDDFEIVVVVPTGAADTQTAVVADALSAQYTPNTKGDWPGRPDQYPVRVKVQNVRYTTRERVKHAVIDSGQTWAAQWTVICVELDESLLPPPEPGSSRASSSQIEPSD